MPGNYSKLVTVITGQTITAAERNNEFDNVINNMTPDGVDDASTNLAAMQATVDPSGGSLATNLRGELQRQRFQLLKLGSAGGNWYDSLPFLAGITPATAGATATDLNNRLAQLASQIKNGFGLTNWYDAVTAALLKAGGTMAGPIAMGTNKITGMGNATAAQDAATFAQILGFRILQIQTGSIAVVVNSTSGTFADTNLSKTITPTLATSIILVLVSQACSVSGGNGVTVNSLQLLRGASIIFGPTTMGYQGASATANPFCQSPIFYIDSPATTSPTTYKTQFARTAGTGNAAVNDSFAGVQSTSTITLIEIG